MSEKESMEDYRQEDEVSKVYIAIHKVLGYHYLLLTSTPNQILQQQNGHPS